MQRLKCTTCVFFLFIQKGYREELVFFMSWVWFCPLWVNRCCRPIKLRFMKSCPEIIFFLLLEGNQYVDALKPRGCKLYSLSVCQKLGLHISNQLNSHNPVTWSPKLTLWFVILIRSALSDYLQNCMKRDFNRPPSCYGVTSINLSLREACFDLMPLAWLFLPLTVLRSKLDFNMSKGQCHRIETVASRSKKVHFWDQFWDTPSVWWNKQDCIISKRLSQRVYHYYCLYCRLFGFKHRSMTTWRQVFISIATAVNLISCAKDLLMLLLVAMCGETWPFCFVNRVSIRHNLPTHQISFIEWRWVNLGSICPYYFDLVRQHKRIGICNDWTSLVNN